MLQLARLTGRVDTCVDTVGDLLVRGRSFSGSFFVRRADVAGRVHEERGLFERAERDPGRG